ncbi:hypothetical protein DB30_04275 [Enhygromyxa salina]|uniref:Fascin-like domain-containing protein n=1 Tax=Enhygromyxa salina TaxID=215803 RepID=A0A0C2D096_9BACT|nr:hypothetical protein [Enhygromyxa salina]KIG16656.1 hypothetical protein DB30_04275 [Enhygromyxa salina]
MITNRSALCTVATAVTLLTASQARAAVESQEVLTPTDTVLLGGMPYTSSTDGEYLFSGEVYQGAPVYVHATSGWSLYRRANGKWHLDFDDISEDWAGTVAYTTDSAQTPWDATWSGANQVATRVAGVYMEIQHGMSGTYLFEGTTHDGMPVYTRGDKFIYYRSANDRWYVYDQLGSSTAWFISDAGCSSPGGCGGFSTNDYEVVITSDVELELEIAHGMAGTFTFDGTVSDDEPVYQRADKFIYNRDANDRWYIYDVLASTTAWFRSDAGCDSAWNCDGYSTAQYDISLLHGGIVSSTSVALETKFGTYVKVNNAGDTFSADTTSTGTKKTFELIELSTGYTLLRAHNGNFVCESGDALEATRNQPDEDCYFTAFYIDDKVAFMAPSGEYIDANGTKNVLFTDIDVRANQTSIGGHEKFTLVNM